VGGDPSGWWRYLGGLGAAPSEVGGDPSGRYDGGSRNRPGLVVGGGSSKVGLYDLLVRPTWERGEKSLWPEIGLRRQVGLVLVKWTETFLAE
jgi:hypothetical protein